MQIKIQDLMVNSGVAFGTSGARGLATAMTDLVCFAYTRGFLQYLETTGESVPSRMTRTPTTTGSGRAVALAGDFRPSTGRIMEAVASAAESVGQRVIHCGRIPSPAVALFGLAQGIPSVMVTGSHIPDDRNGIKFNKPSGEILKHDEAGMAGQVVEVNETFFDATGAFRQERPIAREQDGAAIESYIARYRNFFGPDALKGLRIGVYQHSAVGRDVLVQILASLGAETIPLGRSDKFIPVDTEAIRPEDVELAREWATKERFDAVVSADGDSDRPLVGDEHGRWLRGDVAGILCAKFLAADSVCTPVSCNTAVEKCGWFRKVRRCRIGSPYVIEAMMAAAAEGAQRVVGYEANGGFLIQTDIEQGGRRLGALPTRDALIVILSILVLARLQRRTISELVATLPARFTASDRLKNYPTAQSAEFLRRFSTGTDATDRLALQRVFGEICGPIEAIDRTDGLRITFANQEVIHLRPSGNAPEFRCYSEASSDERARSINSRALQLVSKAASKGERTDGPKDFPGK